MRAPAAAVLPFASATTAITTVSAAAAPPQTTHGHGPSMLDAAADIVATKIATKASAATAAASTMRTAYPPAVQLHEDDGEAPGTYRLRLQVLPQPRHLGL